MTAVAEAPARITGRDVLNHLIDTGSGPGRTAKLTAYLAEFRKDNGKDATGEDVLTHMLASPDDYPMGTLQKAGRFVRGDSFSASALRGEPATDEVESLRSTVAELTRRLSEAEAKNAAVLRENRVLRDRLETDKRNDTLARVQQSEQPAPRGSRPAAAAAK
jgi:hypothetical protein